MSLTNESLSSNTMAASMGDCTDMRSSSAICISRSTTSYCCCRVVVAAPRGNAVEDDDDEDEDDGAATNGGMGRDVPRTLAMTAWLVSGAGGGGTIAPPPVVVAARCMASNSLSWSEDVTPPVTAVPVVANVAGDTIGGAAAATAEEVAANVGAARGPVLLFTPTAAPAPVNVGAPVVDGIGTVGGVHLGYRMGRGSLKRSQFSVMVRISCTFFCRSASVILAESGPSGLYRSD